MFYTIGEGVLTSLAIENKKILFYIFKMILNLICLLHNPKVAGFLSLVSSEVSALMICLITLDRFIVLRFPFTQIRFRQKSALLACGLVWSIGIAIAMVPLLPMFSHWQFYSQTGICLPLPITRQQGPAQR